MFKRSFPMLVAFAAVIFPALAAQAVITSVSITNGTDGLAGKISGEIFNHPNEGANFNVPLFGEDVPAFVDRNHEWNGEAAGNPLPAHLIGAEYIMTANDDRGPANYQMDVTVDQRADLYVMIDQRVNTAANMSWLKDSGFVLTSDVVGVDEGGDGVGAGAGINQRSDVYKRAGVSAGTTTLFQQGQGGTNMYGVVATAAAGPNVFDVLVDVGPDGQRVEVGAIGNPNTPGANTNNTAYSGRLTADNGEQFGMALSNVDWRDRGNSNSGEPLVRLGEDFVKNNSGAITLTLSDLKAGNYEMTTFHVDPSFDQSPLIQIFVTDANGVDLDQGVLGNADFAFGGVNGLTEAGILGTSATFDLVADGFSDVVIRFQGSGNDLETPLSGFRLTRADVPEPTTALLGLFGLAGLGLRRRRQA